MHTSHDIHGVDNETLDCLNGWPEGTRGHAQEQKVIAALNELCKAFGYGRIPQLAAQIEDVWRNPERVEAYRRCSEELAEQMTQTRENA